MAQLRFMATFRGRMLDGQTIDLPFLMTSLTVAVDVGIGIGQTRDIDSAQKITYRLTNGSPLTSMILIYEPE
jgi:hypothetical protein